MNSLAIVSVVFGILMFSRVPMIFAPEASQRLVQKLVKSEKLMRIAGIFVAVLSLAMIASSWGSEQSAAVIIKVLGWILAFAAAAELIVPSAVCAVGSFIWNMNNFAVRVAGVLSVATGAFFICLGLYVF